MHHCIRISSRLPWSKIKVPPKNYRSGSCQLSPLSHCFPLLLTSTPWPFGLCSNTSKTFSLAFIKPGSSSLRQACPWGASLLLQKVAKTWASTEFPSSLGKDLVPFTLQGLLDSPQENDAWRGYTARFFKGPFFVGTGKKGLGQPCS